MISDSQRAQVSLFMRIVFSVAGYTFAAQAGRFQLIIEFLFHLSGPGVLGGKQMRKQPANISPKIQTNQCAHTFVNTQALTYLNRPETDNRLLIGLRNGGLLNTSLSLKPAFC